MDDCGQVLRLPGAVDYNDTGEQMTGYQRSVRALSFQPVDRTPIWGGWTTSADFLEYMSGKPYWEDPWGTIVAAHRKLGVDLFPGEVYGPYSRDEFRAMDFRRVDADARDRFKSPEDVVSYVDALPAPETLEREFRYEESYATFLGDIRQKQDDLGDDILWLPVFRTCYYNWHVQFGYENFLLSFGLYPEAMERLFAYAGEVARLDNQMRADLLRNENLPRSMFNGVDLCSNRGPIVGTELLRQIYFPHLKRALQPLVEAGVTIIWHSDGYISPLIDDLVACGVRGFQGFQEETGVRLEDLPQIALPGGGKPALWGSMSVSRTLPMGTVEDVRREVQRSVDILGPGGGHFLGPSNTIGPEVPFENIIEMHEYAQSCPR